MSIVPANCDWQWLYSWEVLAVFEPRLLDLERTLLDASALRHEEFTPVFRLVRQQAAELVGWSSPRHPVLHASGAYHAVLAHFLSIAEGQEDLP